jgi:hypothetical protein
MFFIFPLIYIGSFFISLARLIQKRMQGFLAFMVFGLPLYTTSLSLSFFYGFGYLVPVLQSFKEIMILAGLGYVLYHCKGKIRLHLVDKLILFFLLYTALYVFLPLGQYGAFQKLLAVKSLSFFVLVYFMGRFFNFRKFYLNQYFYYICLVAVAASVILVYEYYHYTHFQAMIGYADYNYYFFDQEPSGNYGLSWTFEIENGAKRFASFFSNPLEYSASSVMTICILAALYTRSNSKIRIDNFGIIVFASTLMAIMLSLSRASFASYFLIIYAYALLTDKKVIVKAIHYSVLAGVAYIIFLVSKDFQDFVVNTLNFKNESSLGHILEWLDGIQSMITHPLGIGLGESGRIAAFLGENVGGENQFIIIGVQVGVIAFAVYIAIYVSLIRNTYKWFRKLKGKEKKVCLAVLLMKVGFIIPTMTANFESYIYISYVSWFLSGLFINIISQKDVPVIKVTKEIPAIT